MPDLQRVAIKSAIVVMMVLDSLPNTSPVTYAQAVQGVTSNFKSSKMGSADDGLKFDVVSIKPANPGARPGRAAYALRPTIVATPDQLSSRSITVKDLIAAAYGVEAYQVLGGPAWLESDRFELLAKSDRPANRDQLLAMLRPLLTDRCKLVFHTSTKELPVYAIKTSKKLSLQSPMPDEAAKPTLDHLAQDWDMATLARFLTRFGADMPVIDQTGFAKSFHMNLDISSIIGMAQAGDSGPTNESIFDSAVEAIERQTGLKIIRTKAPIEVIEIDHLDRPSMN